MLIKNFAIRNLFGYQDFEINFQQKNTIFVGENGMGKTTILAILYHTLSLNFKELSRFDFETIEIQYENTEKFEISYFQIKEFSRVEDYNHYNSIPHHVSSKIISEIENKKINGSDFQSKQVKKDTIKEIQSIIHNKYNLRIPLSLIDETIKPELFLQTSGLKDFVTETKKILTSTKILYFPTYRRIEEDIQNLEFEEERLNFYSSKEEKISSRSAGELIRFGMTDVAETIKKLLDTIKKNSIDSFNKMTGELLEQYVDNRLEKSEVSTLSEKDINISLNRVGDKINPELRDKIIQLSRDGELSKYKYLNNLIENLVNKNKSLESIDNKIQHFVDICNSYLYGKQFVYNPSKVTLDIQLTSHNSTVELSQLSSGEKQLVSTFSKIFLEDNEKLIILFDEPELSLSISWQENFIYDIFNAENSIFGLAVTHSPYIFEKDQMYDVTYEMSKYIKEDNDSHES
ncbi:AAA family ATPase [Lactococcus petauri]|uniref:AAA family ATPase n=1 Tax=Lactococcus petauri TaxID=1940789 RepID=A0ABZ2SGR6_9LACT